MSGIGRYLKWSADNEGKHHLYSVTSDCILKACLSPFVNLSKYLGVFPVRIFEDGTASFKILHLPFASYVVFLITFIACGYFYAPFYLDTTSRLTQDTIFEVAKYLFVLGQFISASIATLAVPRLSRRTANFWNKLQQILTQILKQPGAKEKCLKFFIPSYRSARWAIVALVAINLSSWYLWNHSFHPFFKGYFGSSSPLIYYLAMGGCLTLATLISTHVIPSLLFILLISVIQGALRSLREMLILDRPSLLFDEKPNVAEGVELYEQLCRLIQRLGQINGRYLMVEMCALFTSVLTSIFAVLSGFERQAVTWETTMVSLLINVVWLYCFCEAGESLYKEQIRCLKALKNAAILNKMSEGWMISKFVSEEPMGITAANYFRISRQLVTQVTGTVVMYLIVMLQFKSQSSHNSNKSLG